ncbi:30S ribosomal protein S17 [Candidatus Sumerlaeota bacterium]|nr:30S ribosomal protein S17 [Candidatus Sumerlaeota bacterium]
MREAPWLCVVPLCLTALGCLALFFFADPLYRKYVRRTKHFVAHDAKGRCKVGDTVKIVETRPMSKTKRWRVTAVLDRAK